MNFASLFKRRPIKKLHLEASGIYRFISEMKSKVVAKLGMPHDYYSFTRSGVRFVMMDTNDLSIYKHPENSQQTRDAERYMKKLSSEKTIGLKPWNGAVSAEQLAWIGWSL